MIELEGDDFSAGDVVAGRLASRPECGAGEEVTVWLVWRVIASRIELLTPLRVDTDYCIVDARPLPADGRHFEFRIPKGGPLTYDGKLFDVVWEVVAGTTSGRSRVSVAAHRILRVRARAAAPLFGAA